MSGVPLPIALHFGEDPTVSAVGLVGTDRALIERAMQRVGQRDPGKLRPLGAQGQPLDLVPRRSDSLSRLTLRALVLAAFEPGPLADELLREAARLPVGDDSLELAPLTQDPRALGAVAGTGPRVDFALLAGDALPRLAPDAVPVLEATEGPGALSATPDDALGDFLSPGFLAFVVVGLILFSR